MADPALGQIREMARPLRTPADLDPLLERIGDARVVAVGEASHGTHEYYAWRAALTRRLVEELGFDLVAVEGDWPDCYRVDRSVRLRPGADEDPRDALDAFARWPTWMWANDDVVDSVSVGQAQDSVAQPGGPSSPLVVGTGQAVAEPVRSQENQRVEREVERRVGGAAPDHVGSANGSEVAVAGGQKDDDVSVGVSGGQFQVQVQPSESETSEVAGMG